MAWLTVEWVTGVYTLCNWWQKYQDLWGVQGHTLLPRRKWAKKGGKDMGYSSKAKLVTWSQPKRACFKLLNTRLKADTHRLVLSWSLTVVSVSFSIKNPDVLINPTSYRGVLFSFFPFFLFSFQITAGLWPCCFIEIHKGRKGRSMWRWGVWSLPTISDGHRINMDIDTAAVLLLSVLCHSCRAQV